MMQKPHSRDWRNVAVYAVGIVLSLLMLARLFRLRRADLSVPLIYDGGDAMFYMMVVKALLTNGWHLNNAALGAPHGMALHDFPLPDTVSFLLLKFIGLFTSGFGRVMNYFAILTFPLTTVCMTYALRKLRVAHVPALAASLLYCFTYYHLGRVVNHLFYGVVFPIPLFVLVLLWLLRGDLALPVNWRAVLRQPKLWGALLVCVLLASTGGAYNSFFGLLLLAGVALALGITRRSLRATVLPCFLLVFTLGVFALNLLPNTLYFAKHGRVSVAQRAPGEAEMYGLKIAQLILPADDHRWRRLAALKARYNSAPLVNENTDANLGVIGACGFLLLLGWLLFARRTNERTNDPQQHETFANDTVDNAVGGPDWRGWLQQLSLLNALALLLGTIGGFGVLFALFVSPQIRAYNRLSVYLSCFAFFAVALVLDLAWRRWARTATQQIVFSVITFALTMIGVWDQSPRTVLPANHDETKASFANDAEFFQRVSATLPAQAMVFQLPVHTFPEGEAYDHFRGYLHAPQLRWSFGALAGRAGDFWQHSIANQAPKDLLATIASVGFTGLYLDRDYLPERGKPLVSELSQLLNQTPLTSRNDRFLFFDLRNYESALRAQTPPDVLAQRREEMLHPLMVRWVSGCYPMETTLQDNWRWCGEAALLEIETSKPRRLALEFSVSAIDKGEVQIDSVLLKERVAVDSKPKAVQRTLDVAPGRYTVRLKSSVRAVQPEGDQRALSFKVLNFRLTQQP